MKKTAYTLIELVMVIVLVAIVSSVFSSMIVSGMRAWLLVKDQKMLFYEANSAIQRMTREIRRTKNTTDAGILIFTGTQYSFVDFDNNSINYARNGTNLERNGQVILPGLPSDLTVFTYLDEDGFQTAVKKDIRTVQLNLIAEAGSNKIKLQSSAGIRGR